MNHNELKELVFLHSLNELDDHKKDLVIRHLDECEGCRNEYDSLLKLHSVFSAQKTPAPDHLLFQAREELFDELYKIRYSSKWYTLLYEQTMEFFRRRYKYVFVASAFMVVGIGLGIFFSPSANSPLISDNNINLDSQINGQQPESITNIRLSKAPDTDGNLEIVYDKVSQQTFSGNINSPEAREFLAKTLLTSDNPGTRIKTVNAIAYGSMKTVVVDDNVKNALINAIKTDDNPAVRKTAITVLAKYPCDEQIKETLLDVLSNDKNSALRVLAINTLSTYLMQGISIDEKMYNILNKKAEADENGSIRYRAAKMLEGVKQL